MRTVVIVVALALLAYGGLLLAQDQKIEALLHKATLLVIGVVGIGAFFGTILSFIFAKRPSDYS